MNIKQFGVFIELNIVGITLPLKIEVQHSQTENENNVACNKKKIVRLIRYDKLKNLIL